MKPITSERAIPDAHENDRGIVGTNSLTCRKQLTFSDGAPDFAEP
jgi:hypothetical protein